MTEKRITQRDLSKERTREKTIQAARLAFGSTDYHKVTIRDLASAMNMSTGAIFSNFDGKAELWSVAMKNTPVPADTSLTRAASALLVALEASVEGLARNSEAWVQAHEAIRLAKAPLDGEEWAGHLERVRSYAPHAGAEKPAAPLPLPSGAAGASPE